LSVPPPVFILHGLVEVKEAFIDYYCAAGQTQSFRIAQVSEAMTLHEGLDLVEAFQSVL
jgi:hypothetical protein